MPANGELIQSNSEVLATLQKALKSCPTDRYLIVSQPNLNRANLVGDAVPNLLRYHDKAQSRYSLPEVIGELNTDDVVAFVRKSCEGRSQLFVDQLELAPLPSVNDAHALGENGKYNYWTLSEDTMLMGYR